MENDINDMFIFIQSFLSNPVHFLFLRPFLFLWLPPSLLVLQSKYWSINLVSTSHKAWRFLQGTSCHLWEVPRLTTFSWTRREFITLFVFIIVFYGTDNVSEYNLAYSPHSNYMWGMCIIYIYISWVYCQSHKTLLWNWTMLCIPQLATLVSMTPTNWNALENRP